MENDLIKHYQEALADLGDLHWTYHPPKEQGKRDSICAAITLKGREYAQCVSVQDGIDYAPTFRGWFAEISEKLARENNLTS